MNSDNLNSLTAEALLDRSELEALSKIEEIVFKLSTIKSEDFPNRLAYLRAKSTLQMHFLDNRDIIQRLDSERIKLQIAPSSIFRYNKMPPSPEPSTAPIPPLKSLESGPILPPEPILQFEPVPDSPISAAVSAAIDISFKEEEKKEETATTATNVTDGGFEFENKDDNDSSSSDSSDSFHDNESESGDDEGIVDDKEPIKVYHLKNGYSSDEEVMNFDPSKLDKRSAKPVARPPKICGNGRYRLRNAKRRLTIPVDMIKACLYKGEMEHIKRWVESKVFQNKAVMTFGSNQSEHTNKAYQLLLDAAKKRNLSVGECHKFEGFCYLCQSAKTVSRSVTVYSMGSKVETCGNIGVCCWEKFSVAREYCEYLLWLEERAESGSQDRVEKALRQFHQLDKEFHNLISK